MRDVDEETSEDKLASCSYARIWQSSVPEPDAVIVVEPDRGRVYAEHVPVRGGRRVWTRPEARACTVQGYLDASGAGPLAPQGAKRALGGQWR